MSTTQYRSFKTQTRVHNLTINTNVPDVEGPRSSKSRTPFCVVCFKAKQPSSVYNSHWTRMNPNPMSPITCPLILKTICKYCKKIGHTAKYCPVAAKKEERRRHRASSITSDTSSQTDSISSISSPPIDKGTWLHAAMKSEENQQKSIHKKTLSLHHPSQFDSISGFPSPPQLRKSRARWDWNADFESDSD